MLPNDYADVAAAAAALSQERDRVAALCVAVQQIAAPTDHEEERAAWVRARFDALGLSDVHVDAHRNVHARVPGRDATAPALLVSAHTDTVFPAHTDLSVRHDAAEERIYGPGIGDNSTGVAALLVLEATVTLHSPSSQNSVSLADYLADAERPSGLITTVSIPLPTGSGTSHRVARTPADTPIVSITGWRTQDGAVRLAATGLGERPFRLTPAEKADIAQAASAAAAANTHPGDFRGSASYRAEMAAVLTRRTLNQLLND